MHRFFICFACPHRHARTCTNLGNRSSCFFRRVGTIKEGDNPVGNHVRARVVKNKCAPPFRAAEFDIMFTHGISSEGDLIDLAVAMDIVAKQGAWYSYGDVRLGQGRENAKVFLKDNPDLSGEIRKAIIEAHAASQVV